MERNEVDLLSLRPDQVSQRAFELAEGLRHSLIAPGEHWLPERHAGWDGRRSDGKRVFRQWPGAAEVLPMRPGPGF